MAMKTVWCPTCCTLDARWQPRGERVRDLTCATCGDALVTVAHRLARIHMFTFLAYRLAATVKLACEGMVDVDEAVTRARDTAHEAYDRKLLRREEASV